MLERDVVLGTVGIWAMHEVRAMVEYVEIRQTAAGDRCGHVMNTLQRELDREARADVLHTSRPGTVPGERHAYR
jgi:hypothetical protein